MIYDFIELGKVCKFVRGPFGGSLKKDIFVKSGYAVYEQQHAIYNQFNQIRYFIDKNKFDEMSRFEVFPNDLIMSCSGTMGKIAIVPDGIKRGIINQALLKLTPNNNVSNKYLRWLITSSYFQKKINELSGGAAIQNVPSVSILKKIKIPLPPLPTQQKIVAKLDKIFAEIDKAITVTEANINNFKILFKNYLDNFFDNNHDLISMPLEDVCEELFAGGDVQKNRFSKFKTSKFFVPIFSNGEKNSGLYGFTDIARVTKPSVTISARGTIGYSEVRYEPFYPAIRLIVATPKTDLIELDYFKYAIKNCKFISSGTSIPQLTIPHIKNYKIKFPQSKEKQKIILSKITNFDLNINQIVLSNSKKLIQLSKLKNSILEQAFNGQLVKAA